MVLALALSRPHRGLLESGAFCLRRRSKAMRDEPTEYVSGLETTSSGVWCSSSLPRGGVSTGTRPARATPSVGGLIQTGTGRSGVIGLATGEAFGMGLVTRPKACWRCSRICGARR